VKLGYDNFSRKDIFKAILPQGSKVPSSYETAGHIAHYNLKEGHFPFKKIIGEQYPGNFMVNFLVRPVLIH